SISDKHIFVFAFELKIHLSSFTFLKQVLFLAAAFLHILPNKVQHLQYHPVSFHCGGFKGLVQLRAIKNNEEPISLCKIKRTSAGFSCSVDTVYPEDSGEYWCETTRGERSNSVNVTVTAAPVILESPALPVSEGDDVILRCRNKTSPTKLGVFFYKDGRYLREGSAGEMTVRNVSKSDEGMYKCSISGAGRSLESWLSVRGEMIVLMVVLVVLLVLHVRRIKGKKKMLYANN
uniref:Ig-like domain-containing protein n=1 Tax=Acanthochromis polyacanthus TaxID=80966 RepID=A0A3Q1GM99_9TELE